MQSFCHLVLHNTFLLFSCLINLPVTVSVIGLFSATFLYISSQDIQSMRKFRKKYTPVLPSLLSGSPEIDNECLLPQSRHCPAEHCTVCDRHRIITDCICNSVCHPVADSVRGLRRHVSWGKSCPACCQDQVNLSLIRQTDQLFL